MEKRYRRRLHSMASRLQNRGRTNGGGDLERVRHELDMLAYARDSMLTWSAAAEARYDALCQLETQMLLKNGSDGTADTPLQKAQLSSK